MSLLSLIPVVTEILDRVLPDAKQADQVKLEMLRMAQDSDLKALQASVDLAKGQIEVNKVEASTDLFRGGWRPAAGWVCVVSLFYNFVLQPFIPWCMTLLGKSVPPLPPMDSETLYALLTGLLGLGSLRTFERVKGRV